MWCEVRLSRNTRRMLSENKNKGESTKQARSVTVYACIMCRALFPICGGAEEGFIYPVASVAHGQVKGTLNVLQ